MPERENILKEELAKMEKKKETGDDAIEFSEFQENNDREETIESKEIKKNRQRYYFHGSFEQTIESIEKDGFRFKDAIPNITTSPLQGMNFPMSQILKGEEGIKQRIKHFKGGQSREEIAKGITEKDAVLFVIEHPISYGAFTTKIGSPNVFSTPEQIPADIEDRVYYRRGQWQGNQRYMSERRITEKPGQGLTKKTTAEGVWEKVPEGEKIGKALTLPPDSLKMIILHNAEFNSFFEDIRNKFREGISIDKEEAINELADYLSKRGDNILKDEIADKRELAENMVRGEMEHYIVSKIRRMFLEF